MAGPVYFCIHRKCSTDASGRATAPTGCIDGKFDFTAQRNRVPGNCSGIFLERPKCAAFHPSPETEAGQRFWDRKKIEPEKQLILQSRIPSVAEAFGSNVRFSESTVASALARVRAEREKLFAGIQL